MAESEREAKTDELPLVLQQRERELKKALEDRHLLLWLHAEAVWERDNAHTVADRLGWRFVGAEEDAARERSSRQAWAEEALRLELALERERKITAAYAEQVRMHHCGGVALSHPADPDKKWTLEELSSVTCYKTGEYTPDVCDGTCYACRPTPLESDEGEEPGEAGFTRPQCTVHPSILPCGHTEDEAQRSVRHELCTAPTESFEGGTP